MTALLRNASALALTHAEPGLIAAQSYRIAGLLLASIVPALFWMMIAHGVAHITGVAVTATTLTVAGAAIATFVSYICAPIMLRTQ